MKYYYKYLKYKKKYNKLKGGTNVSLLVLLPNKLYEIITEHISTLTNSAFVKVNDYKDQNPLNGKIIGNGSFNNVYEYDSDSVIISLKNKIESRESLDKELQNIMILLFLNKINEMFKMDCFTPLIKIIIDNNNYFLLFKKYTNSLFYYIFNGGMRQILIEQFKIIEIKILSLLKILEYCTIINLDIKLRNILVNYDEDTYLITDVVLHDFDIEYCFYNNHKIRSLLKYSEKFSDNFLKKYGEIDFTIIYKVYIFFLFLESLEILLVNVYLSLLSDDSDKDSEDVFMDLAIENVNFEYFKKIYDEQKSKINIEENQKINEEKIKKINEEINSYPILFKWILINIDSDGIIIDTIIDIPRLLERYIKFIFSINKFLMIIDEGSTHFMNNFYELYETIRQYTHNSQKLTEELKSHFINFFKYIKSKLYTSYDTTYELDIIDDTKTKEQINLLINELFDKKTQKDKVLDEISKKLKEASEKARKRLDKKYKAEAEVKAEAEDKIEKGLQYLSVGLGLV